LLKRLPWTGYKLTFSQFSDFHHVVLQALADSREKQVVGVQMGNDFIAVVEVVASLCRHIVDRRLQHTDIELSMRKYFTDPCTRKNVEAVVTIFF